MLMVATNNDGSFTLPLEPIVHFCGSVKVEEMGHLARTPQLNTKDVQWNLHITVLHQ